MSTKKGVAKKSSTKATSRSGRSSAGSIHVRSEDGKHLAGRVSLAGTEEVPTAALAYDPLDYDIASEEFEQYNAVASAFEIFVSSGINKNSTSNDAVRFDPMSDNADTLAQHIRDNHNHRVARVEDRSSHQKSEEDSICVPLKDLHDRLHAHEIMEFVNGQKDSLSHSEANQSHYHARDLSQDTSIHWVPAIELLGYAASHIEMDGEMKDMTEDEGKEALFNLKLAEAKASGLYDAIKAYGVTEPMLIVPESDDEYADYSEGYIYDGYHRLAAAVDINYEMLVPVKYKSLLE